MRKFTMIFCKHTKRADFIVDSFHKKNIILLMLLLFSLLDSFYNISQIFVGYLAPHSCEPDIAKFVCLSNYL